MDGCRKQRRKKQSREELLFHFYLLYYKTELLLLHWFSMYIHLWDTGLRWVFCKCVWLHLEEFEVHASTQRSSRWLLLKTELSQPSNLFLYLKLFNIFSHVTWGQPLPLHLNCNFYPPYFFSYTARKLCQTTRIQEIKTILKHLGGRIHTTPETGWWWSFAPNTDWTLVSFQCKHFKDWSRMLFFLLQMAMESPTPSLFNILTTKHVPD